MPHAPALPAGVHQDNAAARRRPRSMRLRLTVWMIVIAMVIQVSLGIVLFLYEAAALDDLHDGRLRSRTAELATEVRQRTSAQLSTGLQELAWQLLSLPRDEPRLVALFDAEGNPYSSSSTSLPPPEVFPGLRDTATPAGVLMQLPFAPGGTDAPWRFVVRTLDNAEGSQVYLVVGRPDFTYHATIQLIRTVLLLSLPVGLLAAGVAAWLISGLAVAPVRQLSAVAHALDPETITQPVNVNVGRIAELEDVQTAIEDVRERLRLAIGARDRFIAHVSHELKTPIAIILTEAQTLDTRALTPDARVFVRSVIDEMRRLGRTIESFLTLTKVRGGSSLMDFAPCDVAEVVMDAVLGCSRMARQHRVSLNPLLADSDHPVTVNGDAELLRVMVDHLLRSAIRSSPEGSQVTIHVTDSATVCEIAVRDSGPPMVETIIPPAFEPAPALANGAPPQGRRPGLGLSIAQTVARLHSGNIEARTLPEAGCEIAARLPVNAPAPAKVF